MAKKSSVKVRLVPEEKPNSKYNYYAYKPTAGEKAKDKIKLKKYNPATRKHEWFIEKNFHLIVNNYLYFFLSNLIKEFIIVNQIFFTIKLSNFNFLPLAILTLIILAILF